MREPNIEMDDELESALDRLAGRLACRRPEPPVPVSLEQVGLATLQRGIDLISSGTILRTSSVGGRVVHPSNASHPSNKGRGTK